LPEDTVRDRQEVALRAHLGIALMSTKGFGASEVRDAFVRVRELCDRLGDVSGNLPRHGIYGYTMELQVSCRPRATCPMSSSSSPI
jgi:hypothetical protein